LLADLTWLRLGGPVRWLVAPADVESLAQVLRRCREMDVPCRVLGAGANVLAPDGGFDGVVIQLTDREMRRVEFHEGGATAGAGAELIPLCSRSARKGFSGLEPLAGVPATVGGAIRMNAGGRYGQISDVVSAVTLIDRDGRIETVCGEAMRFGYRSSAVGSRIVLSVELSLGPHSPEAWRRYVEIWNEKKSAQPIKCSSAGCVFKNPSGVSAGALIDACGLKGASVGGASVSSDHANFVVTTRGATSEDVLRLMDRVREAVARRRGICLEPEIDIW